MQLQDGDTTDGAIAWVCHGCHTRHEVEEACCPDAVVARHDIDQPCVDCAMPEIVDDDAG